MSTSSKTSLLSLICLGIYLLMSILLGFTGVQDGVLLYTLSSVFISIPAFLLPALWFRRNVLKSVSYSPRTAQLLLCIIIGVGAFALNIAISSILGAIFYNVDINSAAASAPYASNYLNRVLVILSLAIIPAIAEEFFVRGALMEGWMKKRGLAAIMLSASYFSLLHIAPSNIPIYFALGALLGFIYLVTRNVWLTIIIHFINNFISVLISFSMPAASSAAVKLAVQDNAAQTFGQADFLNVGLLYLVVACIFILPSVYALVRYCKKNMLGQYSREQSLSLNETRANAASDIFMWAVLGLLLLLNVFGGLVEFGVIK